MPVMSVIPVLVVNPMQLPVRLGLEAGGSVSHGKIRQACVWLTGLERAHLVYQVG